MATVAFLGLGAMGVRMAQKILDSGHEVKVWNRNPDRAETLVQKGAILADTPKSAAENAEFVIAMVRDDEASKTVWLDPETGAFSALSPDAFAIDCSTLSVNWTKELAQIAESRDINFLEAPVSGSRPHAEEGNLVFFVAGKKEYFERCTPLLLSMGKKLHHHDYPGSGALTKLFTNTLLGTQVAVLAELFGLMNKHEVEPHKIIEAVSSTSSWSPAAAWVANSMLEKSYEPMFTVDLIEKDLDYSIQAGSGAAPVTRAVKGIFSIGKQSGLGELNMSALAKLY